MKLEVKKCESNGLYRIGSGPCVYRSQAQAQSACDLMYAMGLVPDRSEVNKLDRKVSKYGSRYGYQYGSK